MGGSLSPGSLSEKCSKSCHSVVNDDRLTVEKTVEIGGNCATDTPKFG